MFVCFSPLVLSVTLTNYYFLYSISCLFFSWYPMHSANATLTLMGLTSNPDPSFNLKNCSLRYPQGTAKRNVWYAHPALLGYLLTLASLLLHFPCLTPRVLPCSPLRFHPPPNHHTGWPVSASAFHSQHCKEVCYGDLVKAVSTGAKPSGVGLNGWAVRQLALWWETQTSCRLRWGRYWFLSNPEQKRGPTSELPWKKMGVKLGGAGAWRNAKGLSGEYGYGLRLHFIKSTCETHTSKATQVYIFTLFNGYFTVF